MGIAAALTMTKAVPFYDTNTRNFIRSSNGVTGTLPADEQANDLLVAINWAQNASSVNWSCTGYTSRFNQGALPSISLFSKVDGGAEVDAQPTASASCTELFNMMLRFRLATYDTVGSAVVLTTNGTLTTTGFTSAGGLACLAIVGDNTATVTTPTGWTSIFNVVIDTVGRAAFFTQAVQPGSVGSAASTVASNTGKVVGLMFGLK